MPEDNTGDRPRRAILTCRSCGVTREAGVIFCFVCLDPYVVLGKSVEEPEPPPALPQPPPPPTPVKYPFWGGMPATPPPPLPPPPKIPYWASKPKGKRKWKR